MSSLVESRKYFASQARVPASRCAVTLPGNKSAPPFDDETLDTLTRTHDSVRKAGFLKRHGLSLTATGILLTWVALYIYSDPKTHLGSLFGNAIADWTGVVVTVIATKYFYEIGSAESRQPDRRFRNRFIETFRDHSLTIFLGFTAAAWTFLYLKMDSEGKWGQVWETPCRSGRNSWDLSC